MSSLDNFREFLIEELLAPETPEEELVPILDHIAEINSMYQGMPKPVDDPWVDLGGEGG